MNEAFAYEPIACLLALAAPGHGAIDITVQIRSVYSGSMGFDRHLLSHEPKPAAGERLNCR